MERATFRPSRVFQLGSLVVILALAVGLAACTGREAPAPEEETTTTDPPAMEAEAAEETAADSR